jgi:hypothetical protein
VSGFIIFVFLSLFQIPIWFVWKGEISENDETWICWYVENVPGFAEDLWERIIEYVK